MNNETSMVHVSGRIYILTCPAQNGLNKECKMSKLVDKYFQLGKMAFVCAENQNNSAIVATEMAKIKAQFGESDWNELIHSVPIFMRPMVQKQKEKYLR